ncbi:MAG: DNA polymerase III subunit epsilon [Gammaproteobacteria bacterium]|nr:DNA polymerase III subunit epsilon [Gammaproteobacteria bacterium]
MQHRQICLDTETTGLETREDHRIIEIGCVELINRRPTGNNFHYYLNPDREIDQGAIEVHGITNEHLASQPRFHEVAAAFMEYIQDAEVIIHNAPFDVGFLNHELAKLDGAKTTLEQHCTVTDTLVMARKMHPGQRNSLDALCRRYDVNNSNRTLHGALLDAGILADVYLAMTGGQITLGLDANSSQNTGEKVIEKGFYHRKPEENFVVTQASAEELSAHNEWLERLRESENGAVWDKLTN